MSHKEPKISLFFKKLKVRLFVKNNTKTKSKKIKKKIKQNKTKQEIKSFLPLSKRTLTILGAGNDHNESTMGI